MDANRIGVVITTCKRPASIVLNAVQSVLNQTFTNFKLVVVDDSPSDYVERENVKKKIQSIKDPRIIYVQNDFNKGACYSRNKGAALCEGRYIAFLDDDDEWMPDKLKVQMNSFSRPNIGIVYCNSMICNTSTGESYVGNDRKRQASGYVFDKFFSLNVVGSCSFPLILRECFDKVGGFDECLPALQDWDLWMRIAQTEEIYYVPVALCKYNVHEGDHISAHSDKRVQGYEMIKAKYTEYLKNNPKARGAMYLAGTFFYSRNKDFKTALNYWIKAVTSYPTNIKDNIISCVKMFGRIIKRTG